MSLRLHHYEAEIDSEKVNDLPLLPIPLRVPCKRKNTFKLLSGEPVRTLGTWMQADDERFDGDGIQRLYEGNDFPLQRRSLSE